MNASMKYTDGGGILLVTDGPLSREEWERLMKYVSEVLRPGIPSEACTGCLSHEMPHNEYCRLR